VQKCDLNVYETIKDALQVREWPILKVNVYNLSTRISFPSFAVRKKFEL